MQIIYNHNISFTVYLNKYYQNLCKERYKPVEYEIAKDNSNFYMIRLINNSKIIIVNEYFKKKTH